MAAAAPAAAAPAASAVAAAAPAAADPAAAAAAAAVWVSSSPVSLSGVSGSSGFGRLLSAARLSPAARFFPPFAMGWLFKATTLSFRVRIHWGPLTRNLVTYLATAQTWWS